MAVQATTGSAFNREKTGVRRITLRHYVGLEDGEEPWNTLDTWLPDTLPFGLPCIGRNAEKQDDGDWLLTLIFEGVPEGDDTLDDAELDNAGVEDPIETHPQFDALAKKYGAIFEGEKFDGWKRKIKDPTTGRIGANPIYGQSHYLNDNSVLRVTFNETEYTASHFRNLCRIDTPRVPTGSEALRETEDGKQWLKKKVTAKFRGNVWQYVIEWHQGYWTPDIYNPR